MYWVFHHISDHLQRLILFLQILRKVGLRSDPPPLVGQNDQVLQKRFSMAPLNGGSKKITVLFGNFPPSHFGMLKMSEK